MICPFRQSRRDAWKRFAPSIAPLLLAAAQPQAAEVSLEAYASGFDSIAIAVIEFSLTNPERLTRDEPWQVIADDFEFCGRFTVTRMPFRDTSLLAATNTGLVVGGEYTLLGDSVAMLCAARDAYSDDIVFGKRYDGPTGQIRLCAHAFANEMYELLFAERGPFESRMLFIRDRGETKNVYVMDYDGYNVRQVTSMKTINIFPCFVSREAFVWVSYLNVTPDIFKATIGGSDQTVLISSKHTETSPAFSAIENKLAYASSMSGNLEIYVCDLDGGNAKQLTFSRAVDTSPCWSPDGYHIAFVSDRSGQPQIYIMDAEGGNVRRLTFAGSYRDSPAWSPRGDLIAYTSLRDGKFDIWAGAPDGSKPRQVTDTPGKNEYPAWAPDASYIAFQSTRFGRRELYCVRPDGTGLRRLTDMGDAVMPDWSSF